MRKPDPLIVLIILAVVVAIIAPARGAFAEWFSLATDIAIAVLFFLYGARLSPQEALAGLKNWRLHLVILACTFAVYPVIGALLKPLSGSFGDGILYLTLVPSTVQSSVAFTSIAGGNVAGAIVSASASNLAGVVLTPLLVLLFMGANATVDASVFLQISVQLLLPFLLGQLSRRWKLPVGTKVVDRGSIAMVVYSAFSAGIVGGIWSDIAWWQIAGLVAFSVVLVAFMLWLTRVVSARLGFSRADQIAIEFCGSKKSLATGLPMASVIFGGGPQLALLVLPLMIYHQVQLMMCSWLAARYAKQS